MASVERPGKERRSASQILFGHLPEQTVDARGRIWRVTKWEQPLVIPEVDVEALRRELVRQAVPWQRTGKDDGLVRDLDQRRCEIIVRRLNPDTGIRLEPFPNIWVCKGCRRLHRNPTRMCRCGASKKGQLHFVAFCSGCGRLEEPRLPECRTHNEARIRFPESASARDIVFDCPTCGITLQKGFGFRTCGCGTRLEVNVHRSATVYTPRNAVIVNVPTRDRVRRLQEAGGRSRALSWVLGGMTEGTPFEMPATTEALRRTLLEQGVAPATVEAMLAAAPVHEGTAADVQELPSVISGEAESQAVTIALALSKGRTTIEGLLAIQSPLLSQYQSSYREAVVGAGLERVDFLDSFPVLTAQYGFTRGSTEPGEGRLRTFRDRQHVYTVYADYSETEAYFVQLAPEKVARWLIRRGFEVAEWRDSTSARFAILRACAHLQEGEQVQRELETLIHSLAHRWIRIAAVHTGVDRNSLSELLVPLHLGFFVYAVSRGDFVLGGLQAVYETDLQRLLQEIVGGEHRCALDPGCAKGGAACAACLHIGEPSCRHFNQNLDRRTLTGGSGYFSCAD